MEIFSPLCMTWHLSVYIVLDFDYVSCDGTLGNSTEESIRLIL